MGMTPEGKVKASVKRLLEEYGAYYYMPVPTGYGRTTLDFLGCHKGRFFSIETKALGKKPTTLQRETIHDMELAGGKVFVIDEIGGPVYLLLVAWLES